MTSKDQISVPVDPELRTAAEREAKAKERTVAGQIRYWIALGRAADHDASEAA